MTTTITNCMNFLLLLQGVSTACIVDFSICRKVEAVIYPGLDLCHDHQRRHEMHHAAALHDWPPVDAASSLAPP